LLQLVKIRTRSDQLRKQLSRALRCQRLHVDMVSVFKMIPPAGVARPAGHDQQDRRARYRVRQRVDDTFRLGIRPVQILEDQKKRTLAARLEQDRNDGVDNSLPSRLSFVRLVVDRLDVEKPQQWQQRIHAGVGLVEDAVELRTGAFGTIRRAKPKMRSEQLHDRKIWRAGRISR
jgi:hypothetical protein